MSTLFLSTNSRQLDLQVGERRVPCLIRFERKGGVFPYYITSIHFRPRSRGRFWSELPPRFRSLWIKLASQALEQLRRRAS